MSCFYPGIGYYHYQKNESGKRSITLNPKLRHSDEVIKVPCGKCEGCRADQALAWSIRCFHESQSYDRSSFLTMTYNDLHYPSDGKLVLDHLQGFVRSLKAKGEVFTYFACGEYGGISGRAHYHALIFGLDFRTADDVPVLSDAWTNNVLAALWPFGVITCSDVSPQTCCYVGGYVAKKVQNPDLAGFRIMSRKPAIGRRWLEKHLPDLINHGSVIMDGNEYPMPKRYFDWAEHELAQVKKERKKIAEEAEARRDQMRNRNRITARIALAKSTAKTKEGKL